MKKALTLLFFLAGSLYLHAQQAAAPDQNPDYIQSQRKYMGIKDSLLTASNTTIQDTYKAYDFYQAREERRALRRERRYNLRLTRAENSWYPYYNNYNYGYNAFPYYGSRFIPNIGFRSGNWWFGW
jgi:hypothetical protein